MTWTNDDGLTIKFGVEEATFSNIGAYSQVGPVHWVEILVDHSELPAVASNSVILNDNFKLPAGAVFEEVQIMTPSEAFDSSGDGMTFNLGTIDSDRTSNPDVDFFVVAATQTELNAGGTNTAGWAGVAVTAATATPLTASKLLTWEVDTAAATAGTTTIRLKWRVLPVNASDTLVWNKSA